MLPNSTELYPFTKFLSSTDYMSGTPLDTWVHPGTKQAQTLPSGASVAVELCSVQPVQLYMGCTEAPWWRSPSSGVCVHPSERGQSSGFGTPPGNVSSGHLQCWESRGL